MTKERKPKAPPSPLTGLYLVKNRGGVNLKRGHYAECVKYAADYAADRQRQGRPADATEILPERLWVEVKGIQQLLPGLEVSISAFSVEAAQARPTGNRTRQWWGGMDGGMAMFEEWEVTLGGQIAALSGRRFRCYRCNSSELDRGHSNFLIAVEALPAD